MSFNLLKNRRSNRALCNWSRIDQLGRLSQVDWNHQSLWSVFYLSRSKGIFFWKFWL